MSPVVPANEPETAPKIEKPAPQKPTVPVTNAELERAWDYYRRAVERGITDSERIELLESMLLRWGEVSADKIVKELERVKRRIE